MYNKKQVNGVELAYEEEGSGPSVIWVHGGWGDRHDADLISPLLVAKGFRVIRYDRRGHSDSERPEVQEGICEAHVADLVAIIEQFGAAPAHLATNSFGGELALKVATRRPELVASIAMHEPNLFGILGEESASVLGELQAQIGVVMGELMQGNYETAASVFMDRLVAPGTWNSLPEAMQDSFVFNAPTVITDFNDPTLGTISTSALEQLNMPILITNGSVTLPWAGAVVERLSQLIPDAKRHTYEGAGHLPQVTHAEEVAQVIGAFLSAQA